MTTHAHLTAWILALILFFVALSLHGKGKEKGFKVLKMIVRVMYLLIIGTGIQLLLGVDTIGMLYIAKAAVGLWIVVLLELILNRKGANVKANVLWIQLAVAFILVLFLGFKLPFGILLF